MLIILSLQISKYDVCFLSVHVYSRADRSLESLHTDFHIETPSNRRALCRTLLQHLLEDTRSGNISSTHSPMCGSRMDQEDQWVL